MLRRSATCRQPLALALVALALLAIAGCGSSSSAGNGVASKTPAEILAATKAAADSASSVHVAGALGSGGSPITLDLGLVAGHGGRGRISEGGLAFELIVVAGTVYIKGSPSFYSHYGGAAAAQLFRGRWLKAPATTGELASLASLASLTNLGHLLDQTLSGHGTLARGATTTVSGQPVIELRDTAKDGSLYVATTGQPFPIAIVKRGAEAGRVAFTNWNEPVALSAPSGAIDLSQLQHAGH
jgi:hypothetical protein